MVSTYTKGKNSNMIKIQKILIFTIISILFLNKVYASNDTIYEKIDLFGEVLDNYKYRSMWMIVNQSKTIDGLSNQWTSTVFRPLFMHI